MQRIRKLLHKENIYGLIPNPNSYHQQIRRGYFKNTFPQAAVTECKVTFLKLSHYFLFILIWYYTHLSCSLVWIQWSYKCHLPLCNGEATPFTPVLLVKRIQFKEDNIFGYIKGENLVSGKHTSLNNTLCTASRTIW